MTTLANIHLITAIVDIALFLEFSSDDVIEPDAAVEAMEQIAGQLQQLDAETKLDFINKLPLVAKGYKGEKAEFVQDLALAFGLTE